MAGPNKPSGLLARGRRGEIGPPLRAAGFPVSTGVVAMNTPTNGTSQRVSRPKTDMSLLVGFAKLDAHLANERSRVRQAAAEDAATFFAEEAAAGRLTDNSFAEFWHYAQTAAVLGMLDTWNSLSATVPANAPRER